jgi:hypothetical protein
MRLAILISVMALVSGAGSYGAILAPGDVIKVDFSSTPGSPGPGSGSLFDWNLLSNSQTISSGSVILSGSAAVVQGVSLSVNGNGSNMDGNTANWPGFGLDPYYIPAADGLIYTVSSGLDILPGPYELDAVFSGLDPSYVYNVRLYWLIDESLANFDAGATNGDTTEIHNNINRIQVFGESSLDPQLIFDDVSPNSLGQIIVSTGSKQPTGMAAIALEVESPASSVPEPGTLSLLALGGIGILAGRFAKGACEKGTEAAR